MSEGVRPGAWPFFAPAAAAPAPARMVDREQAERFAKLLFDGMTGHVHLRGLASEPGPNAPVPYQRWLPIDDALPAAVGDYVEMAATNGYAAYILPHPVREGGGGLADILEQRVIPIDIDDGDIPAKVTAIKGAIGEPWLTVESGGEKNGQRKVHLYYRLAEDAAPADFERVRALRAAIAIRFGADTKVGNNPAQILRVPGSEHVKPKQARAPCRLLSVNANGRTELGAMESTLGLSRMTKASDYFDFSNVVPLRGADMDRVLMQPILAESASEDGLTRFEGASAAIGHFLRMVREGRLSPEEAWEAVVQWNTAALVPPWSEDRLRNDFERLVKIDTQSNGPLVALVPAIPTAATGLRLADWYARDRFIGKAPERRWLVDGLIPRGTPGVFAAVGDAGKSMMALRLANIVASYPSDQPGLLGEVAASHFFGQPILGRGTAVFLTGEDDAAEVHRRLDTIDPSGTWRAPHSRLIVLPLLSAGGARAVIASGPRGPELTPAWRELRAELESLPDLALVVLDPLTLFVGGDTNDNAIGAALMGELNQLATKTGAAVMMVHHFAKAAKITNLSDARNAVLGAGAWINNARWGVVMWEADHNEAYSVLKSLGRVGHARQAGTVYFGGLTKSNAPGAKVLRTLVRDPATGLLDDATEELRQLTTPSADVDRALHSELMAIKGKNSRFSFTSSPSALQAVWGQAIRKLGLPISKDGRGRGAHPIKEVFDRMLDAGLLVETADHGKSPRYEPVEPE